MRSGLIKKVAFFGDAHTPREHDDYIKAYQAARRLALEGYGIVDGGGPGIMDAATQGAESVDGYTVAVTMRSEETTSFEGRYVTNLGKVDREIITPNYIERMYGLIEEGDAFVVFRGGSGTMSELGTIWVLANIYYGHHKPFVLYGVFWQEILDTLVKHMNIDEQELDVLTVVDSEDELVEALEHFEWKLSQVDHDHCEHCQERAFLT